MHFNYIFTIKFILIQLFLLIIISGCYDEEKPNNNPSEQTGCESFKDCDKGEVCSKGDCVVGECSDVDPCFGGRRCDFTTLTCTDPINSLCYNNYECGPGLICIDNKCIDGNCNEFQDCPNNEVCNTITHYCESIENRCVTSEQCLDNFVCINNECMMGECATKEECDEGFICDLRSLTCVKEDVEPEGCTSHEQCPFGEVCKNEECIPGCRTNNECPHGEECSLDNNCVSIVSCIDGDNDGYGEGCANGPDCNDADNTINPSITEDAYTNCDDGIDHNCSQGDAICGDIDQDNDGVTVAKGDCDDNDPNVFPSTPTKPSYEINGNGKDDDCDPSTPDKVDIDNDGYDIYTDCNDTDPNIHPNAVEIPCNNIDENCVPSDDCPTTEIDEDNDGFTTRTDCDDSNENINPDADEIPYNGLDDDCSATTKDDDIDEDTFRRDEDCDDNNASINPGNTEIPYNSMDDDCNPVTKDDDIDNDTFGYTADCNDNNPDVNPNAHEVPYNNLDDDCDEKTSDNDVDQDTFIAKESGGNDCDDNNSNINPEKDEIPYNGYDDDCNTDTSDSDVDKDGYKSEVLNGEDCNDYDANINPSKPEIADDGIDQNCDGSDLISSSNDDDNDGYTVNQGDCDDNNENVNPSVNETPYNGLDDDCNSDTPDDDLDKDSYLKVDDCDDNDPEVNPIKLEIMNNGKDDDCNPNTPDTCNDDTQFEDNDTFEQAKTIEDGNTTGVQFGGLKICPNDDDWFKITLGQGDGLEVDVFFEHTSGDIDVDIYRKDGSNMMLVTSAYTTNDNETAYINNITDEGDYYIKVTGYDNIENTYDFTVNVFNQCIDDVVSIIEPSEHNDNRNEAKEISQGKAYSRQLCDFDEDWYSFTIEDDQIAKVHLYFDNKEGDLDLSLYYEDDTDDADSSITVNNYEMVEPPIAAGGKYYVRVYSYYGNAQNQYNLMLSVGEHNSELGVVEESLLPVNIPDKDGIAVSFSLEELSDQAIITGVSIERLLVNHSFPKDMKISLRYTNSDDIYGDYVVWGRLGGQDDGGFDDDDAFDNDIDLISRPYSFFNGIKAKGELLTILEDTDFFISGSLEQFSIRIEYYIPY